MAESDVLFPAIMSLIQKLTIVGTTLHPPVEPSPHMVSEFLFLNKNIPKEAELLSLIEKDQVFEEVLQKPRTISDVNNAPLGQALQSAFAEKLAALEENTKRGLWEWYHDIVNPVDRASIEFFYSWGQYAWNVISPKFSGPMQEGKFFGQIDTQKYKEAIDFSFSIANKNLNALVALRKIKFLENQYIDDLLKKRQIMKSFQESWFEFEKWYTRYHMTQQLQDVLHKVFELYGYHLKKFEKHTQLVTECRNKQEIISRKIVDEGYSHLTKVREYHELLYELFVSQSNALMSTRSPLFYDRIFEKSVDLITSCFVYWNSAKRTRSLNDLLAVACKKFMEECQQVSAEKESISFDKKIEKYIDALAKDHFFHVFRLFEDTLHESLPQFSINFDWKEQKKCFENYKRLVDCSVFMMSLMESAIPALTSALYQSMNQSLVNNQIKEKSDKICQEIGSIQERIGSLQAHRYLLKLSFMKFVKTQHNKQVKGYDERFWQTLGNKVKRYAIEGDIFDHTPDFNDQVTRFSNVMDNSFERLNRSKDYITDFLNLKIIEQSLFITNFLTQMPDEAPTKSQIFVLLPLDNLNFSRRVAKEIISTPVIEDSTINEFSNVCRQMIDTDPAQSVYWRQQWDAIEKFKEVYEKYKVFQEDIQKLQSAIRKLKSRKLLEEGDLQILGLIEAKLNPILSSVVEIIGALPKNLKKQIRTDKNKQEGFSFGRTVKSFGRKVDRLWNEGHWFDQKELLSRVIPQYTSLYHTYWEQFSSLNSSYFSVRQRVYPAKKKVKDVTFENRKSPQKRINNTNDSTVSRHVNKITVISNYKE